METYKELYCLLKFHVTAYGEHVCMNFIVRRQASVTVGLGMMLGSGMHSFP